MHKGDTSGVARLGGWKGLLPDAEADTPQPGPDGLSSAKSGRTLCLKRLFGKTRARDQREMTRRTRLPTGNCWAR